MDFSRAEYQQVWHGRVVLCVSKAVELAPVEPQHAGLLRFQFHRDDTGAFIFQVMNVLACLGKSLFRDLTNGACIRYVDLYIGL